MAKNNLYIFTDGCVRHFVAAKNWKAARNILIRMPEYKTIRLTDLSGKRMNVSCTDQEGILDQQTVYRELAWWECRCGAKSFLPLDDGSSCRCIKCGRETRKNF